MFLEAETSLATMITCCNAIAVGRPLQQAHSRVSCEALWASEVVSPTCFITLSLRNSRGLGNKCAVLLLRLAGLGCSGVFQIKNYFVCTQGLVCVALYVLLSQMAVPVGIITIVLKLW